MSPLAASILGYVLGLATALLVVSIVVLLRGARDLQRHHLRDP